MSGIPAERRRLPDDECARRQRLAVPGLVGGPLALLAAAAAYVFAAEAAPQVDGFWGTTGTVCLAVGIALLVWGGHFMDCTDRGGSDRRRRDTDV